MSRLTPLGLMILALLREGDMHPYEMIRLMRIRGDDRLVSLQNGTFYHTVARLEHHGFIAEVGVDRDGRRPERTTYALQDAGRDAVSDWVRRELARAAGDGEFRVALAEAHNLDRDEVLTLLRERRATRSATATALSARNTAALSKGIPEQFLVEIDHGVALLTAELTWLDALIHRLERGAIPWGADVAIPSQTYLAQRKAAQQ